MPHDREDCEMEIRRRGEIETLFGGSRVGVTRSMFPVAFSWNDRDENWSAASNSSLVR